MGKERPFEWGAFELLDMSGKSLGIQFTDENGEFWFTDLKPGKYTVRERPDLIDRNDLDGDGHPDIVDAKNGDGLPEQMGNGIPDTKEGLMDFDADRNHRRNLEPRRARLEGRRRHAR